MYFNELRMNSWSHWVFICPVGSHLDISELCHIPSHCIISCILRKVIVALLVEQHLRGPFWIQLSIWKAGDLMCVKWIWGYWCVSVCTLLSGVSCHDSRFANLPLRSDRWVKPCPTQRSARPFFQRLATMLATVLKSHSYCLCNQKDLCGQKGEWPPAFHTSAKMQQMMSIQKHNEEISDFLELFIVTLAP